MIEEMALLYVCNINNINNNEGCVPTLHNFIQVFPGL